MIQPEAQGRSTGCQQHHSIADAAGKRPALLRHAAIGPTLLCCAAGCSCCLVLTGQLWRAGRPLCLQRGRLHDPSAGRQELATVQRCWAPLLAVPVLHAASIRWACCQALDRQGLTGRTQSSAPGWWLRRRMQAALCALPSRVLLRLGSSHLQNSTAQHGTAHADVSTGAVTALVPTAHNYNTARPVRAWQFSGSPPAGVSPALTCPQDVCYVLHHMGLALPWSTCRTTTSHTHHMRSRTHPSCKYTNKHDST